MLITRRAGRASLFAARDGLARPAFISTTSHLVGIRFMLPPPKCSPQRDPNGTFPDAVRPCEAASGMVPEADKGGMSSLGRSETIIYRLICGRLERERGLPFPFPPCKVPGWFLCCCQGQEDQTPSDAAVRPATPQALRASGVSRTAAFLSLRWWGPCATRCRLSDGQRSAAKLRGVGKPGSRTATLRRCWTKQEAETRCGKTRIEGFSNSDGVSLLSGKGIHGRPPRWLVG